MATEQHRPSRRAATREHSDRPVGAGFALLTAALLGAPAGVAQACVGRRADPHRAIFFVSDRDSTPTVVKDQLYLGLHGGRVVRLTHNLDADWWPALSPDGRFVAWLKIPVGSEGIAAPEQSSGHICRLAQHHGRWSCRHERARALVRTLQTSLAWTQDSRTVLYAGLSESGTSDIFSVTEALPSQQRRPSWSPDGRSLAFWGQPTSDLYVRADIFRMRADGSPVVNLTDDQDPAVGDIMPDWGHRTTRR